MRTRRGAKRLSCTKKLFITWQSNLKKKIFFLGFNPPPGGPGGQGGDVTAQDQEKVHQHQISFLVLNATSFIYWGYYPVSLATYLVFFCS